MSKDDKKYLMEDFLDFLAKENEGLCDNVSFYVNEFIEKVIEK